MYKTLPHIGEIVYKTFSQKGFSKEDIARELGISRHTLYKQLDRADMKTSYVFRIGKIIDVDFTTLIPSLKEEIVEIPEDIEEAREAYLTAPTPHPIEMTIRLDGTLSTLNRIIDRIRSINELISLENS